MWVTHYSNFELATPDCFSHREPDTGVAVRSEDLAKLFSTILRSDIAKVPATPETAEDFAPTIVFLGEKVPAHMSSTRFPSKSFTLH